MPTPRIAMRQIRQTLRLHYEVGLGYAQIGRALGAAKATVGKTRYDREIRTARTLGRGMICSCTDQQTVTPVADNVRWKRPVPRPISDDRERPVRERERASRLGHAGLRLAQLRDVHSRPFFRRLPVEVTPIGQPER